MKRKPAGASYLLPPYWRRVTLAEDFSIVVRARPPIRKLGKNRYPPVRVLS